MNQQLQQQAERLFRQQVETWDDCKRAYDWVCDASRRVIDVCGRPYILQYNPKRRVSATANVVDGRVDRPCFLCDTSRPAKQRSVAFVTDVGHPYELLLNPFPITERHFTIVSARHEPQTLVGRVDDMAALAEAMPDYVVFFNGAKSGASAPDHLHFQAVPQSEVPMTTSWTTADLAELGVTTERPAVTDSDRMNVICWCQGTRTLWRVVERTAHRPSEYYATDDRQLLISPASLEFCGLVPLSRIDDYNRVTADTLLGIFGQVERREPMVHVGIMDEEHIEVSAGGKHLSFDVATMGEGQDEWILDSPFTLHGVTIGKAFHWEQREDQTFGGALRVLSSGGKLHAINVVPVETYLTSVISSEMSATNNIELLKAHAVISRSWLLRQIQAKQPPVDSRHTAHDVPPAATTSEKYVVRECDEPLMADVPAADRYIYWWDHDDHSLYDVCADDHCQRYQGTTRVVSPTVAQAIEATRGEVLLDDGGDVCDARFSKCCGGRSERFDVCWQDIDVPYLQPVDDPWCDTHDEKVLRLVLNDYDQKTSDFHDWTVTYTQDELSELIERKMHLGLGTVEELVPLKRGASGRIEFLKVVGGRRTVVIGKELVIRKALSDSHLFSSAFAVDKKMVNGQLNFILAGRGWGHGVGLCQIGAAAMSQAGRMYDDILTHYFKGASLAKVY